MKYKKNLFLFPQNYEANIICRYREELEYIDFKSLTSYQDNIVEKQKCQDIFYEDDIQIALVNSEGIVLCDNVQKFGKKAYINCLQKAAELNKVVYTSSYLFDWLGRGVFENNEVVILNDNIEKKFYNSSLLLEIDCPVISILGMGENCDKFEVLLSMKKSLQKKGYKVLSISANSLAKLLGSEVLPSYIYSNNLSGYRKIIRVNHYIYELVANQNPDIVIIGHAGGIMNLGEYDNNYFGEISYILSNAVASDYGIFCTYFNRYYTEEYFEELTKFCGIRLGIDILRFYVSKQMRRAESELKSISYDFYSNQFYEKNFPRKLNNKIIMKNLNIDMDCLTDEIIDLLTDNPEII